jgi:hypothetical protein
MTTTTSTADVGLISATEGVGNQGERSYAKGGNARVGEPVIVGEKGPEMFVADRPGTIIPNKRTNPKKTPPGDPPPAAQNSGITAARPVRGRPFQKGQPATGRPFQKGQSGNPGGRPKSKPFREALEAVLEAAGPDADLAAIARALCGQAIAGNVQGIREVADRLDGKVPQAIAGIDEDEHLTPLAAIINLGRTQPRPASKASGPRSKARRLRSSTAARPAS